MKFNELNIIAPILNALNTQGYKTPTPIQEETIPLLLKGYDVIGIAQTGTGKTAAFTIPILQKLAENSRNKAGNPRALVLAPTRELAMQINESFKVYGKFLKIKHMTIFGGVGIDSQIRELKKGTDIIIATPGRLMDLMNQGYIDFRETEFLVLDECDRLLDMGFIKPIKKIASTLPVTKQSLFFSATMSNQVADLTLDFLKNPVRVDITPESTPVDKIEQCVFFIDNDDKIKLLLDLIREHKIERCLVFTGMKHKANRISTILRKNGIESEAIHGNKSQASRTRTLAEFKKGNVHVLVATDVAARGIDIDNITHVINYDLPNEPENYVHRIGRTARAGNDGIAYSFCCATDRNYLNQIERVTKRKTPHAEHKYHSLTAKNAEGEDAKPAPRVGRSPPRKKSNNVRGKGQKKRRAPKVAGSRSGRSVSKKMAKIKKGSSSQRVRAGRTKSRRV
ncbi:DEAD/DEAH box helicase [Candidatus Pacearchaeota archaeon]|nr:DEAD/DEAH box helicase [Candidatus Pacearchaeota archaeon]